MTDATAAQLATPTDLDEAATMTVADALKIILANSYAVYLKTKNFHWHVSGPYFRDYHLLLDEQAAEIPPSPTPSPSAPERRAIVRLRRLVTSRVTRLSGTTMPSS